MRPNVPTTISRNPVPTDDGRTCCPLVAALYPLDEAAVALIVTAGE
jgi:hypothetical protein